MSKEVKYDLVASNFTLTSDEIKNIDIGLSKKQSILHPNIIDSFYDLEDAEEELKNLTNTYKEILEPNGVHYVYKEIYIQKNYYDEYGDLIEFGKILKYADGLKRRG